MDNGVIRWYNRNRRSIWIILLIIIAIIALIQELDKYYEKRSNNEDINNKNTISKKNDNYSAIAQEKLDESTSEEFNNLIDDFFDNCNNNEIEKAYSLLSDACKKELYPTVNDFKNNYYDRIFTEVKYYKATFWMTDFKRNIYRIEIMPDLLAAGQKIEMPIEDYYTIINENGEYKLNINRYVGKENINVLKNYKGININIISKDIYMDYEIYKVEIKNNTGKKFILNNKERTDSLYIKDENGFKNIAFLNEIAAIELEMLNGSTRTLDIKFNRGFKLKINIKEMVFEDVVINEQLETLKVEI